MLTEKAMSERKWGCFPALRLILESKRVPDHYYGPSSVSDNSFDRTCRIMEIDILVHEHRAEIINILGSASREQFEQMMAELASLQYALRRTKNMLQEAEERVGPIMNEARHTRHIRRRRRL
jgi:hypothetical protein